VVRLAELMFRGLRTDVPEATWRAWRRQATEAVVTRRPSECAVFVVDDPDQPGRLAACGTGVVSTRMPNPFHRTSRCGYVQWMSTEPSWRRRGMARAVLRALLDWFESHGVDNVELHATAEGAALYRSEGFWPGSGGLAMRRRPWDPPPEMRAGGTS